MNKITTIGMPIHGLIGLVLFALFFNSSLSAQETFTTIRKNVNPLAHNLNHELSSTQDSLLLENKFLFKRVRFISDNAEKVFDFKPAVMRAKIPLDELPLGDYTVMFYQADKIIVFQINRLLPFGEIQGLEADIVALKDSEVVSETIESVDIEFDAINDLSMATNDSDFEIENELHDYMKGYNLSDLSRDNVQTRADYRRNNLRPNGKPYND